jgi:hypothetical protein
VIVEDAPSTTIAIAFADGTVASMFAAAFFIDGLAEPYPRPAPCGGVDVPRSTMILLADFNRALPADRAALTGSR